MGMSDIGTDPYGETYDDSCKQFHNSPNCQASLLFLVPATRVDPYSLTSGTRWVVLVDTSFVGDGG